MLISFLEENFGSLKMFPERDLKVDSCQFCNDEMHLNDIIVVGNDECFDGNDFYQYVLDGEKLYKAYYDIEDEEGNIFDRMDLVDYEHAYKVEDVTDQILDTL